MWEMVFTPCAHDVFMNPEVGYAGRVLVNGLLIEGVVDVADGRIVNVRRTSDAPRIMDFGSKVIIPAGFDAHVHFRDPGMTHKEDVETGSTSAIFGGITGVLEMPNTVPHVLNVESLLDKQAIYERRSWVDFGLAAGLTPNSDVRSLESVAIAFKVFMSPTTTAHPVEFEDALHRAVGSHRPVIIHPEHPDFIRRNTGIHLEDHNSARPPLAEVKAIEAIVRIATGFTPDEIARHSPGSEEKTSAWTAPRFLIHFAHISTGLSIPALKKLKPYAFTSEVTPAHLLLHCGMDLGPFGKVNPPLRKEHERLSLWRALIDGIIDIVASDHAPHLIEEKDVDFEFAPAGLPCVETTMPLMLKAVKERRLSIHRLVEALCTKPPEIFGVKKGRITPGYDADLVVIDMGDVRRIRAEDLHSKCGWTPFEGEEAIFPYATILRGRVVQRDGALFGDPSGRSVIG